MERRTVLLGVGAGVAGLAGCSSATGSGESDSDVGMSSTAFLPAEIEVSVGETVVWDNTSARPHTVTAYESGIPDGAAYFASGGFDSEEAAREMWWNDMAGAIESGRTYSHTFEVPGEYTYFCVPHEKGQMVGTINVE
jgi:plastocyanin